MLLNGFPKFQGVTEIEFSTVSTVSTGLKVGLEVKIGAITFAILSIRLSKRFLSSSESGRQFTGSTAAGTRSHDER